VLVHQVSRYHGNHFFTGHFFRILNFHIFIEKIKTFQKKVLHFYIISCSFIDFGYVLAIFKGSRKIMKSKMADPKWPPFENLA